MAFCTCKYCLCLFKIVVIICLVMVVLLLWAYVFFGNMPPSFTMAIGFWLLLYTNFFGIYLLLVAEATFKRNEDIWWVNKMTHWGILSCAFLFALGGVLFAIPITAEAMMSFSLTYIKLYGTIPPFLDLMQKKYSCCGIYSYLDYGRPGFHSDNTKPGGYGSDGFNVYRLANPNDDFFHELITDLTLNRTVARRTTGLDIPQSCCPTAQALSKDPKDKDCGKEVEYTGVDKDASPVHYHKQQQAAQTKVNNHDTGCFTKYHNIQLAGKQFQLTYMLFLITLMSFIQCIFFAVILWFHRMALKTIRQLHFWLPELEALYEQSEIVLHHAAVEAEADEAHDETEHSRKRSIQPRQKKRLKGDREMVGDRSNLSIHRSSNLSLRQSASLGSNLK